MLFGLSCRPGPVKNMNDFFLDALFFVTAVYSIPFLEEEYIFIDNFRINQSYGLSLNSLIQCTAVCSRLKGKCCMLNFEREIRKCFLSSNCSELRTDLGGRTFKRKSFSGKIGHLKILFLSTLLKTLFSVICAENKSVLLIAF